MYYNTRITAIGKMVKDLLKSGLLVVFNEDAPVAVQEITVLHTIESLEKNVEKGDSVIFGDQIYLVTAVGSAANNTLKNLGHCTFSFSGRTETLNPGWIELKGVKKPILKTGDCFQIRSSGKDGGYNASQRSEDY
ncbi:PTS glucitol/sorbitol transporter subunit IIA [Eubacteriaceae bacterium ES3]|nr:PTS glucitol/sorbitol transporter subunit IIA [Eubacteriaceae bacterium ES3]